MFLAHRPNHQRPGPRLLEEGQLDRSSIIPLLCQQLYSAVLRISARFSFLSQPTGTLILPSYLLLLLLNASHLSISISSPIPHLYLGTMSFASITCLLSTIPSSKPLINRSLNLSLPPTVTTASTILPQSINSRNLSNSQSKALITRLTVRLFRIHLSTTLSITTTISTIHTTSRCRLSTLAPRTPMNTLSPSTAELKMLEECDFLSTIIPYILILLPLVTITLPIRSFIPSNILKCSYRPLPPDLDDISEKLSFPFFSFSCE